MAKRVSPTAIGVFVVASFALVVAALIVVGSGNLFRKPLQFICVFQGDVNGLKVGAPVKFKGVQIGFRDPAAPCAFTGASSPGVRGCGAAGNRRSR
jgi:hypothetical protein